MKTGETWPKRSGGKSPASTVVTVEANAGRTTDVWILSTSDRFKTHMLEQKPCLEVVCRGPCERLLHFWVNLPEPPSIAKMAFLIHHMRPP